MKYVIETKGRTLEETAALFDGEQPALELQQIGHEAATQTLSELQAATLRARLDVRLQEDSSADSSSSDKTTEKNVPVGSESSEVVSRRQSERLNGQRPPSVVSIHLP